MNCLSLLFHVHCVLQTLGTLIEFWKRAMSRYSGGRLSKDLCILVFCLMDLLNSTLFSIR